MSRESPTLNPTIANLELGLALPILLGTEPAARHFEIKAKRGARGTTLK